MVPYKNANDKIRLCVDFRKLNAITFTDQFYIPRVDETLDKLGGAKYLSKLGLSKGSTRLG